MNALERRVTLCLASIYALRMLGLFMIMPVFALYATHLAGSTPFWVGIALGVYGLSQALFQVPFGILSDRWGRKQVIILGLAFFTIGSLIAAKSVTIWGVISGRALQGSGAIASALLALASDLTGEEKRTRVMAVIGFTMGASFAMALVLGPFLNRWVGVEGLFLLCASLGLAAIGVVSWFVPQTKKSEILTSSVQDHDTSCRGLYVGVFILHFLIVAIFLSVPFLLKQVLGANTLYHSGVYLLVLVMSFVVTFKFIQRTEVKDIPQRSIRIAVIGLGASFFILWQFPDSVVTLMIGLLIFFSSFNFLEATLPSLLSKRIVPARRGKSFGIYSTAQFLGAFAGGAVGGWLAEHGGISTVLGFSVGTSGLWYLLTFRMQPIGFEWKMKQKLEV